MSNEDELKALDKQLAGLELEEQNGASGKTGRDERKEEAGGREEEDANEATGKSENVRVMVRCRPLIGEGDTRDKRRPPPGEQSAIKVDEAERSVELADRQFQFDAVFGPQSDNERVYMRSVRQLVESAFAGYNCTVFLYGQTGTGKTYTHSSLTSSAFVHLFSLIKDSDTRRRFLIRASYYELYNEEIRDLLAPSGKALELRESKARGVYVKDLSSYLVNNLSDLEKLKKSGDRQRATAATKMNEHSSRSHSIFSITVETVDQESIESEEAAKPAGGRQQQPRASKKAAGRQNPAPVRVGRLNLIDLAGSERQSKSGSSGARLKEASRINLSLTCLALVIRSLTDSSSSHVPYRNSKLTRLLSSSLGGNSRTLLIACISPARVHLDESLNTLRFASRTKRIKNRARINEDAKDALLRKYRRQIEDLRTKLQRRQQLEAAAKTPAQSLEAAKDAAIESLVAGSGEQPAAKDREEGELLQQLRLLRGKIMVGGENLLEKAEMHERLLEASRQELREKREQELKLQQLVERKRELIDRMQQSKGGLEEQVAQLDEKLKRALILYKRAKEERKDSASEHQQLKESLLQQIRATSKEIKYADCLIDDFIPREYLDVINTYAQYDDESDEWQIKYIALSGNNIAQTRRLVERKAPNPLNQMVTENTKRKEGENSANFRPDPFIWLKDLAK